jgi:hypothetical protein
MQHALEGGYNANFAKFLLQNMSDYRDKVEVEQKGELKIVLPNDKLANI